MTEAEFRALVKEQMAWRGWACLLDLSDRRKAPSGIRGAPDLLFATRQKFLVWFEAKATGGKRSDSQVEWHERAAPYLCDWHRYVCADSWESWIEQIKDLL